LIAGLALVFGCAAPSSQPDLAEPGPRVLRIGDPVDNAAGAPADSVVTGSAGGYQDAAIVSIDASAIAAELAPPDAGADAAPIVNECGGLGELTCSAPPCELGAECAIVRLCDPAYPRDLCIDCPGADMRCQEAQCGGAWRWECKNGSALRCSNGRSVCQ
jgi:hypothetical protein